MKKTILDLSVAFAFMCIILTVTLLILNNF
jgi:hypothetical protein